MSFWSNLFSYTSRSSPSPFHVVGSLPNRSFLIYVDDMAGATDEKILLYAVDTAILVSNKHVDAIELKLKTALETISDWLVDNKLSIHLGKTESILFVSKRKLSNCDNLKVSCNGVNIEAKTSVRYFGASIDNCMSGDSVALSIIQKASCRLKFLYNMQSFLIAMSRNCWYRP